MAATCRVQWRRLSVRVRVLHLSERLHKAVCLNPMCSVCPHVRRVMGGEMMCDRCMQATYCDAHCHKACGPGTL